MGWRSMSDEVSGDGVPALSERCMAIGDFERAALVMKRTVASAMG